MIKSSVPLSLALAWILMLGPLTYAGTVAGRVTRSDTGEGVPGLEIKLDSLVSFERGISTQTDTDGYYSAEESFNPYGGVNTFSIIPVKEGAVFQPDRISGLAPGQDYLNQDFVELCPLALSGRITRADSGEGMDLIPVQAGSNVVVTTNGGYFSLEVPYEWSGDVQLSEESSFYPGDFHPLNYSFGTVTQNHDGLDFSYERPVAWSTYIGGAGTNDVAGAVADALGNIYVLGTTDADGWISGGFQTERAGGRDAFVTKLNPQGLPVWSTYLGGANDETAVTLAVAPDGGVVVAGTTTSSNWVSGGVIEQKSGKGSTDNGFLVKLTPSGQHEWSTYLGTTEVEGLAITEDGTIVATGWAGTSPTNEGTFTGWWKGRVAGGHPNTAGNRPGTALWMEVAADGQTLFFSTDLGYRGVDMASEEGGGQYVVSEASAGPIVRKCQTGLGYLQFDWPTNGLSRYWWQGGGGWRVAGGTNWLSTGEGLVMPTGTYTIEFKESTRMRPAPMDVTVARGHLHQMEVAYGDKPFANFQSGWNEGLVLARGSTGGDAHHNTAHDAYGGDLGPVLTYLSVLGDGERGIVDLHLVGDDFLKFDGTGTQNGVSLSPMIACMQNSFFPSNEVPDRYVSSWYTSQDYWKPCSLQDGWQIEGGEALIGNLEPEEVGSTAQWRVVANNATNLLTTSWFTNHHELASCVGDVQIECKTVGGTTNIGWLAPMDGLTYMKITNFPVNYEWQTVFEGIDGDAKKVDTWPDGHVVVMLDRNTGASFAVIDGETGHVLFLWQNGMIDQPVATMHDMATSLQAGTNQLLLSGTTTDTSWLGGPTNWGGAFLSRLDEEGNWVSGSVVHPQANGQYIVETTPGTFVLLGTTSYSNGAWNVSGAAYPGGSSAIFATQVELWTPPPPERPLLGEGTAGDVEVVPVESRRPCRSDGVFCSDCTAADPMYPATGQFYLEWTDLAAGGRHPCMFQRVYSTLFPYDGPFGFGWTHNFNQRLYRSDTGELILRRGDWTLTHYTKRDNGRYAASNKPSETLSYLDRGGYELAACSDNKWYFNEDGTLARVTQTDGMELYLTYSGETKERILGLSPYALNPSVQTIGMDRRLESIDQVVNGHMTGVRIELDYDANGRITTATLMEGITDIVDRVSYIYDETDPGLLIGFSEPEGQQGDYQYDEKRRLVSFPAMGVGWGNNSNRYDDAGRLSEQIVQGGRTLFAYDESALRTYVTNQVHDVQTGEHLRDQVQGYHLDGEKRIVRRVTQLGHYLDPEGGENDDLVTEYDYDPVTGAVLGRREQGVGEPRAEYSEYGLPVMIAFSNSAGEVHSSHISYDENGWLLGQYSSSSLAPGVQFNRESWQYDDAGRVIVHDQIGTDGSIRRTLREYEELAGGGHVETVTRPDGSRGRLEYDERGNRVRFSSVDDPSFDVHYTYDDQGRLTHHVDALGGAYGWAYDLSGNLVRRTDPVGREDRFIYENGRLIQEERNCGPDEPGQLTRYVYDEHGNMSMITHGDTDQVLRRFGYDSDGRMIWEEDAAGLRTCFEHDAAGRVLVQQDRYGVRTTNRYDAAGRLVGWADSTGRRQDLVFDEFDRVITAVDDAGTDWEQSSNWIYDEAGRVTEWVQSGGRSTRYEYNAHGEMKAIHADGQSSEYYAYDSAGRPVTYSNDAGRVISRSYDALGRIQEIRDGTRGVLQRYTYDANDNLTSLTDANGHVVYYRYDAAGQLLAESIPNAPEMDSVTYAYNAAGQLRRRTNANGAWTELFYDESGQVTQRVEMATAPWTMQYDSRGNLIEMGWPDGSHVVNEYRGNRLTMTRARSGDEIHIQYDAMGRISRETGPFGETEYERDGRGFPLVLKHGGKQISWTYDSHGRLQNETRPDGAQTHLEYDEYGRLNRRSGDAVLETLYEYDPFGQLIRMEDGRGDYVAYTRDDWGRVVEKTYSDGSSYGYAYDGMGRRVLRQQPSGKEETLSYSPAGSWTGLVCGTEQHSWTYDDAGQLIRIESGAETNRWSYDEAGRIAETVQERSGTTNTYEYNAYGQLEAVSHAGCRTAFSYDAGGRVIAVSNLLGEFQYEWDSQVPRIGRVAYPCGAVISNAYDETGRLIQRVHRDAGGDVLWSCNYSYDAMGRRTNEVFGDGVSTQYAYDSRGQLVQSTELGSTGAVETEYHYAYDAGGNRTSAVEGASVSTYEMGQVHRYDEYSIDGVTNSATYDANGNLTTDGRFAYEWDDLNRLNAVIDGSRRTEYDYDGLNRKVERRDYEAAECIQTLRYLYDGNRLAGLLDDTGRMKKLFLWGMDAKGNISAQGAIGGLLATVYDPGTPEQQVRYHLEDERGTLRQRLDESGDMWDSFDCGPWGEPLEAMPDDMESVPLWHGKANETKAELVDFGFRHYHAQWGRWLNPDPAGEADGLNLYRFAGNDPINHTDAKGLILVAFDGTWNNKDDPTSPATNVERMHDMYEKGGGTSIYVKGPAGLMGGATGNDPDYPKDFKKMLAQLVSVLSQAKRAGKQEPIDIIGFSRGACRANTFARYLEKYGIQVDGECVNPRIRFMGLYDRVCAKGLPGTTWDPGEDKGVPGNVGRIVHLVSEHERRGTFLANRFCDPRHEGFCPSFMTEIVVPGVHSDIGGGYSNKIGQALFHMGKMMALAREAGVREWPGELPREYAEIVEQESREMNLNRPWHDSCDPQSDHAGMFSCGTPDSPRTVDFALPAKAAIDALNWEKTREGLSDSRLIGVRAGLRGDFEMLPDGTYKMKIGNYWYTQRELQRRGWVN